MFSFTKHERLVILILAGVVIFGSLAQFVFQRSPWIRGKVHFLSTIEEGQKADHKTIYQKRGGGR